MKADEELLAAYLDGVAELTAEERHRVEAKLAELDVAGTRGMIDQLRALPPEGTEPDWRALERRIAGAVDAEKRPWWRRWLVLAPIGALAITAAAALLWLRHEPAPPHDPPVATLTPDAAVPAAPTAPAQPTELWLDGQLVEVGDVDPDVLFDDSPEDVTADGDDGGLLPAGDLGWIDQLDDHAMDRAEHWLERKKS